jgi:drug/metabolite transporter (DMT)-like permease
MCIASSATLVGLAHVAPATAAAFRCFYALPVLGVLAWREQRRLGPRTRRDRVVAQTAGVFFAIDLLLWHHAIAAAGAGIATVLGNLQVVFVGFGAWAAFGRAAVAAAGDGAAGGDGRRGDDLRGDRQRRVRV